jgi:hypothetical protein
MRAPRSRDQFRAGRGRVEPHVRQPQVHAVNHTSPGCGVSPTGRSRAATRRPRACGAAPATEEEAGRRRLSTCTDLGAGRRPPSDRRPAGSATGGAQPASGDLTGGKWKLGYPTTTGPQCLFSPAGAASAAIPARGPSVAHLSRPPLPVVLDRVFRSRRKVRLTLPLVPAKLPEADQESGAKGPVLQRISDLAQRSGRSR